jgi:hypothetical protein
MALAPNRQPVSGIVPANDRQKKRTCQMRRSLALFAALVIGLDGYSTVMAGRDRPASNRDSSSATTNGQPSAPSADPFDAAATDNMPRASSDSSNRSRRAVGDRSQPTWQPSPQPMQVQPQEYAPLTPRGSASSPRPRVGAETKVLPWAADRGVTVDRPRSVQPQPTQLTDRGEQPARVQLVDGNEGRPAPTDRGDRAGNGNYGPRIVPQQQSQQQPQQVPQQQAPTTWQPTQRNPVSGSFEVPQPQPARQAPQPQQQVIAQPQSDVVAQPGYQNGGRRAVGESRYEPQAQPRYQTNNQPGNQLSTPSSNEPTRLTPQPAEWRNVGVTPSAAAPAYRGGAVPRDNGESWQSRYAPAVAGPAYRPEPVARASSSSRTSVSVGLGFNSYDNSGGVSVGVNYNSGYSHASSGYRRGYYEPAYRGWGYDPACYYPAHYYSPVVYRPVYYCPPVAYPVYYGEVYVQPTTIVTLNYNSGCYDTFSYCPAPVIYVPPPQPVVYVPPPPVYYVQPVAVAYSPVCYPVYRPGFSFSLSFFGRF